MICIGHRGAAGIAPENTILAIQRAYGLGVRTFEIDVRNVHDALLVFHDPTLDRVSDRKGRLSDYPLIDLQEIDLGEGQKIPLLRELLQKLPEDTTINIELADYSTGKKVLELLGELSFDHRRVLISSFLHPELEIVRSLDTDIPIGLLIGHHPCDFHFCRSLAPISIGFEIDYFDKNAVEMAKKAGLLTMAYTVNDPRDMRDMKEMGIDAIFTDFPERAKPFCRFEPLFHGRKTK